MNVARTAAALRCAGRHPGPGRRLPARGRAGHRRAGPRPGARPDDRGPGPAGDQRDRRVDRRDPGDGRPSAASSTCAPPRAIHLVVPRDRIQSSTGLILRTEKSVLFVIPWGRHWIIGTTDTDWDAGQGAPGGVRAGHRLPARARQRGAGHPAHPGGRRGRVRRAAAAADRRVRRRPRSCPASTSSATSAPGLVVVAGGKYTTYRVMAKDAVDAVAHALDEKVPECVHRPGAAGRRGRLPGSVEPAAHHRRGVRPARRPDRAPARPVRLADRRGAGAGRRGPVAGRAAGRARRTTCGSRSSTRHRTRARGTWTTCWPAAPGSRSRPGTAASGPPRTRPT